MGTHDSEGSSHEGSNRAELDRTPLTIMVLLVIVAAVQFVHYYGIIPDRLVTHFDMAGRANGWMDRAGFVATMAAIEAIFVVGALLFVRYAARIPTGIMNIPNRDYWLQPERKDDTLRFIWSQILWIETATLAFLIAVTESVFRANMTGGTPSLPSSFFYVLAAFVVLIVWLSLRILIRFRREE